MAMTVAAMGVVYSLRGAQDIQVAAHAKTHSEASAWAGVEVFRKYLYEISADPAALGNLSGTLDMSIASLQADLSVEIVDVIVPAGANATDTYDITANIRSYDEAARSTTVLQVYYRVAPFACQGGSNLNNTLDFHRNLNMGGSIAILSDTGATSTFFVNGDISLNSISATGIGALYGTGDVDLGSGVYVPEVRANGNIRLSGSASIGRAYAVGTLSTSGSGRVIDQAEVNGVVTLGGGVNGNIRSVSDVNVTSWITVGDINTASAVTMAGGTIGNISARGNVDISGGSSVDDITTESNVSCPSWWKNYNSIIAAGNVSGCGYSSPDGSVPVTTGATVSVDVMVPLQPFDMEPVKVDAWALRNEANYIFEYVNHHMMVNVQHVNSILDGAYYIVTYNNTNYLCSEIDNAGQCVTPSTPVLNICNGFSANNTCFSYDADTETWRFDGKNMAPGLVWVKGNLNLGNGHYYNTFVVTGSIETDSSHKTEAINFAGYEAICTNQFPVNSSSRFEGLYPKNFCDTANGELLDNAVGNIGLLAGGYPPDPGDVYEGGDIMLGASSEIFGTVMSGNYLTTGGSTTIHGYMTASGLGPAGSGRQNSLGGSTTVDLRSLPSTYDPASMPDMGGDTGSCSSSEADVAKTFWSRYL